MEAGVRNAPGDRGGDVEEVAVSVRPRPEHAVAEGDRVRLSPGHLLAERGTRVGELVRGAGEGGSRAERAVSVHEEASALCRPGIAAVQLRVEQVHRTDVEGGRDADAGAAVDEAVDEVEAGLAVVEAGVDVRAADVDQLAGPGRLGGAQDEPHGEGGALPGRAVEQRPVARAQRQAQPRASSASMREIFSTRG